MVLVMSTHDPALNEYTTHQRRLIKERFYRWVLNNSTGSQLNWRNASEMLKTITGFEINDERLRKNFKPVSKAAGRPKSDFRDVKVYRALHRFLKHPTVCYLTDSQLFAPSAPAAAALGLDEFLNDGRAHDAHGELLEAIKGRFLGEREDGEDLLDVILDIDYDTPDRLVEATLHVERDGDDEDSIETDCQTFSGWVNVGRPNFVLFLLRDTATRDARAYHLLRTYPALEPDVSFEAIALLAYDGFQPEALLKNVTKIDKDHTYVTFPQPEWREACQILTRERVSA